MTQRQKYPSSKQEQNWHVSDNKGILTYKEYPLLKETEIMPALVARKNTFAEAQTFGELYAMFRFATSPDNLVDEIALTNSELAAHYAQLRADFEARDAEIYDALMNSNSRK